MNLQTLADAFVHVATTPREAVLLLLLLVAAVIDVRSYRVPNALTVAGMLLGLLVGTFDSPVPYRGFLHSLGGLVTGLSCLLPLHALKVMGAGDVKLMAVVGAFVGLPDVLPALVFIFLAGGATALGYSLLPGIGRRVVSNLSVAVRAVVTTGFSGARAAAPGLTSAARLPYAVCIGLGTATFLVARQVAA